MEVVMDSITEELSDKLDTSKVGGHHKIGH